MDLTQPLTTPEEYHVALEELDRLLHINDCCAVPPHGAQLYDRIKEYEATFKID
jgi:hypothetical protein